MKLDARDFSIAWRSVAIASGSDKYTPVLSNTVLVEAFGHGIRLVSTDSYIMLIAWVPARGHEDEPEPNLDDAPELSCVVMDPHKRGLGLLGHAIRLYNEALDGESREDLAVDDLMSITLDLGVIEGEGDDGAMVFSGMEPRYAILDIPDQERVKLRLFDGNYPTWRGIVHAFTGRPTSKIALGMELLNRIASLRKYHPGGRLGVEFTGENKMTRVQVIDGEPHVYGILMPVKWDVLRNQPMTDTERQREAQKEADQELVDAGAPTSEPDEDELDFEQEAEPEHDGDALFGAARDLVTREQNASTRFLQDKLNVGRVRATRILEELADAGVVGPLNGSKPRDVLVMPDSGL